MVMTINSIYGSREYSDIDGEKTPNINGEEILTEKIKTEVIYRDDSSNTMKEKFSDIIIIIKKNSIEKDSIEGLPNTIGAVKIKKIGLFNYKGIHNSKKDQGLFWLRIETNNGKIYDLKENMHFHPKKILNEFTFSSNFKYDLLKGRESEFNKKNTYFENRSAPGSTITQNEIKNIYEQKGVNQHIDNNSFLEMIKKMKTSNSIGDQNSFQANQKDIYKDIFFFISIVAIVYFYSNERKYKVLTKKYLIILKKNSIFLMDSLRELSIYKISTKAGELYLDFRLYIERLSSSIAVRRAISTLKLRSSKMGLPMRLSFSLKQPLYKFFAFLHHKSI